MAPAALRASQLPEPLPPYDIVASADALGEGGRNQSGGLEADRDGPAPR